jgi:predicted ATP-binding protein involved in virulence
MKIKQISVTNLFGLFNHVIPLKTEDRITIIHGPNGFGKTIMLNFIDGLFKGNYSIFKKIPFDGFCVDFDNGKYLTVKKHPLKGQSEKVSISIQSSEQDEITFSTKNSDSRYPILYEAIGDIAPELRRIGSDEWMDRRTGQIMSWEEITERYGDYLPARFEYQKTPKWLKDIKKQINTHFIQTNRLLRQSPIPKSTRIYDEHSYSSAFPVSAVNQYSIDLVDRIQQTFAKSGELSQSLDRTFPIRLLSQRSEKRKTNITEGKLQKDLRELENTRERLTAIGLMGKETTDVKIPDQIDMDDINRIVLPMYVKDAKAKLKVFDDILEKIGLLQKIINDRYSYSYKRLIIDRQKGFVFETRDGSTLPPNALSSGEQHELVLFYELLFRIRPGSFILIDEPEISLHIAWQQVFLKDIMAIAKLTDIDVLIATHSADIIYDKWNLTVELKGPDE